MWHRGFLSIVLTVVVVSAEVDVKCGESNTFYGKGYAWSDCASAEKSALGNLANKLGPAIDKCKELGGTPVLDFVSHKPLSGTCLSNIAGTRHEVYRKMYCKCPDSNRYGSHQVPGCNHEGFVFESFHASTRDMQTSSYCSFVTATVMANRDAAKKLRDAECAALGGTITTWTDEFEPVKNCTTSSAGLGYTRYLRYAKSTGKCVCTPKVDIRDLKYDPNRPLADYEKGSDAEEAQKRTIVITPVEPTPKSPTPQPEKKKSGADDGELGDGEEVMG